MSFVGKRGVVIGLFWTLCSCTVLELCGGSARRLFYLGHGHDKWHHGFYLTLQRPDNKTPCCNLTDCRPTAGRLVDDHYEVKVNGAWVSVPPDKVLKQSAPDLGFHVCAPFKFDGRGDHLYCGVVPPEI